MLILGEIGGHPCPISNVPTFALASKTLITERPQTTGFKQGSLEMSYDARQIANFVIDFCHQNERSVSNLSLQKVVYFCHVWSLVELNKPLVRQAFEAWKFGPVIQHLYHDFKQFDRSSITEKAKSINPKNGQREVVKYDFDDETEDLLRKVVDFYTKVPAGDLVDMTHAPGGPWHKVWNHQEATNPGMKIRDEDIRTYHSDMRRKTNGSH